MFSFIAISCLVGGLALAQESDATPPSTENGMVVEEFMTDISGDMVEILDQAAQKALEEEDRSAELKMDEEIKYEDLNITGDARILPDSFLYSFKNLGRGIDTFFTFDPVKKAEKELDYANKKIMETHQLVEAKGMDESIAKAVEKTIISAEKDLGDIANVAEKLKESRADDAPKVEEFLDKIADHTLKQQKVIEKLEEKLPEKNLVKVVEAKEMVLEHFGETMVKSTEKNEDITTRINKAMDAQTGSGLKDLKNLEVLEVIKEKVPEGARVAIEQVQEDRVKVFQEKFKEMPEEDRAEKVDKYLGDMKGNALRQFDVLDNMKRSAWVDEELIKELDILKDKMVKKFEKKFTEFKDTVAKDKMMEYLMDGDPDDFRTLEQIEMRMGPMDIVVPPGLQGLCFDPYDCGQYCAANPNTSGCDMIGSMQDFGPPPEVREAMKKANEETVNKFKTKFANDPEALKRSEAIQRALSNPDAVDFKLLDAVYESMPEEQKTFADQLRKDVEGKMMDMMKGAPMGPLPMNCDDNNDGIVDEYEAQRCAMMPAQPVFMMDRFVDTNPETIKILKELQNKVSEADKVYIEQAINTQMNRMSDYVYKMNDQGMLNRMKYQMEQDVTVKREIETREVDFFSDIDTRGAQLEEELRRLDEEKMRRMDEMKMEMMRGQTEIMQYMPTQTIVDKKSQEVFMQQYGESQRMMMDKMKERGIDPCDFNYDGIVDDYEKQQCKLGQTQAPPPQQGFFNKVKNIMPFSNQNQTGPQCGNIKCPANDYCADAATGFCCPNGTTFQAPNQCVGQSQQPQDRSFIDKFRDFMPLVPNSGLQCGNKRCGSDAYCANPSTGKCCPNGHKYNPSDDGCLGFYPGSPNYDPCDYNQDGNIDDSERQRCGQIPTPIPSTTGMCGDGRCEPNEYCPQDCATGQMSCNNNGVCENNETKESCPSDCAGGGMMPCTSFVPIGQSCNPVTGTCCSNGTCSNMYGLGVCESMNDNPVPVGDNGTQTCSSKGGTCCNVCANNSYISGTECNCCGTCSNETTSGGNGSMISCSNWVRIGESCNPPNGICCSNGMCSNMNGPGICESGSYAPPSGSGCSCADGYWSDTCNCAGHESYTPPAGGSGCQCSCGWSETCNCATMCPEPPPTTTPPPGDNYMPPPTECPPEGCMPMSNSEYPRHSWLRRVFTFIFGF